MPQENIRSIKRRIKSIKSIEHITNAMKLVSGAKFRKAKIVYEKTNKNLTYIINDIDEILARSYYINNDISHNGRTCYIVITSNTGLCGNFSSGIIKKAVKEIEEEKRLKKAEPYIAAIGAKGRDYFQKRQYEILNDYPHAPENTLFEDIHDFCAPIMKLYGEGKITKIVLIYNSLIDALQQKAATKILLPYQNNEEKAKQNNKYIEYEPSHKEAADFIIKKYLQIALYRAVIESTVCEYAARRTAMENATDNAREMIDELMMEYNAIRQGAITNEISEIVRGSEALKQT